MSRIFSLFSLLLSRNMTVLVQQKIHYFMAWFHSWTFPSPQTLLFSWMCDNPRELCVSRAESCAVQSWPRPSLTDPRSERLNAVTTENNINHFLSPCCHLTQITVRANPRTRLKTSHQWTQIPMKSAELNRLLRAEDGRWHLGHTDISGVFDPKTGSF